MLKIHAAAQVQAPSTRTQQPIVTGSTVLGVKYKGGVMLAADTLCSYGSLARYKDARRIQHVGDESRGTLVGASGEYSDFQNILEMLREQHQDDVNIDDGHVKSPSEVHNYLRAVLYRRRSKMDPLWNQLIVAGYSNDKPYLGYVDMIGTCYEENFLATGFGAYIALPIIRDRWSPDMDEGEARELLQDCLRVLFYRDCRASNRIQIAKATTDGTLISDPFELETDWETANFDLRHPSGMADGSSW